LLAGICLQCCSSCHSEHRCGAHSTSPPAPRAGGTG
jgi:hypothetical protein